MLNRRILRIKAFKVLYGYSVSPDKSLQDVLSELDKSCESTRSLYLYMLAIISPLTKLAKERIEAAKTKIFATNEELNPNEKFADNLLADYFDNDPDFQKLISKQDLSWEGYDILLKKLLDSIASKPYFNKYMESGEKSIAEDCRLFVKIFENEFNDLPEIDAILEDKNLYWADDLAYSLTWCCHSLDDIAAGKMWRLPELYQSDIVMKRKGNVGLDSDRDFVRKLVSAAVAGFKKYFDKVVELVPDWDSDRLFSTDMALIALCLAEIDTFSEIPNRVSLNEYLEISKFYCAPKSRQFVNGILDRILKQNNITI